MSVPFGIAGVSLSTLVQREIRVLAMEAAFGAR
jgi:hypothetical protein